LGFYAGLLVGLAGLRWCDLVGAFSASLFYYNWGFLSGAFWDIFAWSLTPTGTYTGAELVLI
ncbi:unnamed protein product, partial [Ilex paraguariensis]